MEAVIKKRLLLALLIVAGCSSGKPTKTVKPDALINLVKTGDLASIRITIDADKTQANATRSDGVPLLYFAAANGHKDIVRYLLDMGAAVDARISNGSALHVAVENEFEDVVQELLRYGANPNFRDASKQTPLHRTTQNQRANVAKRLLDGGGDVSARDDSGRTPLHRCKSFPVAELLISRGADVNAADDNDYTPLHWAGTRREIVDRPTIQLLLNKGADTNRKEVSGLTPRQLAIQNAQEKLVTIIDAHKLKIRPKKSNPLLR